MPFSNSETTRLFISADGTPAGAKNLLAAATDITLNLGKSIERVKTKDQIISYQRDEGASMSTTYHLERPAGVAQAAIQAAHDAGTPVYAWLEGAAPGDPIYEGEWFVAISSVSSPADGLNEISLEMSINGALTIGAVA